MASLVGKALVKRTFLKTAEQKINTQNPFEEEIPVLGKDGRPTGKVKKRKRAIPPTISANDGNVLKKVRRRAWRLDMSLFNCCGIRFGWSSVIGILPVVGDVIDLFLALMVVRTADKIDGGLPAMLKSRMYFNIMLDFGLGLIPLVGDLVDAVYRANTRNCWLLEVYLTEKATAVATGQVTDPESGAKLSAKPIAPQAKPGQSSTVAGPVQQPAQAMLGNRPSQAHPGPEPAT